MEEAREFQKKIDFCFIDYAKGFDCVDHTKLWIILKEMEISDIQAGFRKDRGTRYQIANIRWIIEKAREFLKNI